MIGLTKELKRRIAIEGCDNAIYDRLDRAHMNPASRCLEELIAEIDGADDYRKRGCIRALASAFASAGIEGEKRDARLISALIQVSSELPKGTNSDELFTSFTRMKSNVGNR